LVELQASCFLYNSTFNNAQHRCSTTQRGQLADLLIDRVLKSLSCCIVLITAILDTEESTAAATRLRKLKLETAKPLSKPPPSANSLLTRSLK